MMWIIIYTFFVTQLSMVFLSIYVHRGAAHGSVQFHPVASHVIRVWLWLTEGVIVKDWARMHHWHHKHADTDQDPHLLPSTGVWRVSWLNFWQHLCSKFSERKESRYRYHAGEDWADRHIYNKHYLIGLFVMLAIDLAIFDHWGLLIWAIQMVWGPFWMSAVANGLGHYCGYRNYNTNDASTNLFPVGLLIGGDELHNNHHYDPANPCNSKKWWEFDLGYAYIKILVWLGLAKTTIKNR